MNTIALIVEYDGGAYCGWQRQKNGLSVQQVLEEAIFSLTEETLSITGAGRTDAGVHALGQTVSFRTQSAIPPEKWALALNTRLPGDIRVRESFVAEESFHARFSAKGKHYSYTLFNRPAASALYGRYSWHVPMSLDVAQMRAAAQYFIGKHDFSAFMAAGAQTRSPVREIMAFTVTREGERLILDVFGDGFLYNQVRIMTGTLLYVGLGKLTVQDVAALLDQGVRKEAGPTAPPQGLCLQEVFYRSEELIRAARAWQNSHQEG